MSFSSIRPSSVPNCVCGLQLSLISSTEEAIKNGLTLPTGQWYAPSAVNNDALIMPEYNRACQSMPEYARLCQSMPEYARVCQSMQEYARVCQSMPEYARVG